MLSEPPGCIIASVSGNGTVIVGGTSHKLQIVVIWTGQVHKCPKFEPCATVRYKRENH